jgi:phthalate 4,5-cis-dihydrodiol dehydrogenase
MLAAGADTRAEARAEFTRVFGLPAFDSVEAMCRSRDIDAVWIATPNVMHCTHAVVAAENGKHVICEKPMAISLAECDRMIEAAYHHGVQLLQGHSKVFDAPIRAMRAVIDSGHLGRVIQIDSWNFNDWLQRPRLASEVDTKQGGGLVFRQGPHMLDVVRYLAGGLGTTLRAVAGRHDPHFATEGNFAALIEFENGAIANLGFNGYGYFDGSELTWDVGEGGEKRTNAAMRKGRPRRTGPMEAEEKYGYLAKSASDIYGHGSGTPFYGLTVVSCERGVIRQSEHGLFVYTQSGREEVAVPPSGGHSGELIELRDALAGRRTVFPDGRWGRATLEACLAVLESSRLHRDVPLQQQVPSPRSVAEAVPA